MIVGNVTIRDARLAFGCVDWIAHLVYLIFRSDRIAQMTLARSQRSSSEIATGVDLAIA